MEPEKIEQPQNVIESTIDWITLYIKVMISILIGFYFFMMGIALVLTVDKTVLLTSRIYFLIAVFVLLCISLYIHGTYQTHVPLSEQLKSHKTKRKILFLLINAVAFLFNAIYLIVVTSSHHGYHIPFGGIETFILKTSTRNKNDTLNMIDGAYGLIFSILYFSLLIMIIGYGLYLKDKLTKAGNDTLGFIAVIGSILIGFGLFLFFLFNQELCFSATRFLAGSLVTLYGTNLFTKNSIFSKSELFKKESII
jgi:hypothetical protein